MPPRNADYPQTYRIADLAELKEHPENPRQGDVGAIHTSVEANGWYGALTVQKSTGYILTGNHRKKERVARGMTRVPIIELDVDDATALRILLGDNRTADLASYDDAKLLELLQREAERDNLAGTGYDGDDVDDLARLLADPEPKPEPPTRGLSGEGAVAEAWKLIEAVVWEMMPSEWVEKAEAWRAEYQPEATQVRVKGDGPK